MNTRDIAMESVDAAGESGRGKEKEDAGGHRF